MATIKDNGHNKKTMATIKRIQRQTIVDKTLHINLKIELHKCD